MVPSPARAHTRRHPLNERQMNISVTDITDVEKEIEISTTNEELAPRFEEAYKQYQKTASVKGFRKGKVPLSMIRQVYGESIRYSSLDGIANDLFRDAMEERNIRPVGDPVLTTIDYTPEAGLNFKIKYEILPDFPLGSYRGMKVEKPVHEITEAELTEEMDRIRRSNSTLTDGESIASEQTLVTADLQELDEGGTPLVGRKTADAKLYLADESIFRDIREKLIGAPLNGTVRLTIEPREGEEGEKRNIEVTVKQIKNVELPEVTDEFVQKITKGKTKTVADFNAELRESLRKFWEDRSRRRLLDTIISEIVRLHDFIVPESLIRAYTDSLIDDTRQRSPGQKLPPDFDESAFREEKRGAVMFQVKWHLVREKILADAGIELTEEDYERYAERDSAVIGVEKERLVKMYRDSAPTRDRLITEKLHDFLISESKVKEVVTAEAF